MEDQVTIRVEIYRYPNLGYTQFVVYSDASGQMRYQDTFGSRERLGAFLGLYMRKGDNLVEVVAR
jgi:hypothetical protein